MSTPTARRRDLRLAPTAALAWLTAAACILHPGNAAGISAALWAGALVAVGLAWRGPAAVRAGSALAAVALAMGGAVGAHVAVAQGARDAVAALPVDAGRTLEFEVVAVGKIEGGAAGRRFDALLQRTRIGQDGGQVRSFGGGVPVLVRLAEVPHDLDLGARVRVTGTAWRPDARGRAVLVVDAVGEPQMLSPPTGVWGVASALRRGLSAQTTDLPAPAAGLIAGLAVGDTSAVAPELDEAMKASSLSHLTAVSGANCALVVALAFGAAAVCGARRGVRVAAGLGALAGFVVLVSPEPSVVRAAVMAAIAMLGVMLGRPGAGVSLLTTAVVLLLVADPWLALSIGFALSVAATAALLLGAGPLADGLSRWMPRVLALGISVPLAAQLACGPLIVLISPRLSVYGVVANLVAAPAAPPATIVGLAACVVAGVPILGEGIAGLAWLPAAWIAATALTVADLPGSVVDWPDGLGGLVCLAVLGVAVAALLVPGPARRRVAGALVLAAALGVWLGVGPVADVRARGAVPAGWAVAACDVGQGDAIVLRSAGRIALVDTGPDAAPLSRCLDVLGVDRIDLLVLTHFDLDHRGGIDAVQDRVDTLLHGPVDAAGDTRMLARLAAGGVRVVPASRGMTGRLGAAHWRVLWPTGAAPPGNAASVVVEFGGEDMPTTLLLGDLDAEAQRALMPGAALLAGYDVVKVAHHGSADQEPGLYERLRPAVAVVTAGENTYGHPRAETLALLRRVGARIARTDLEGIVALWVEDGDLRLWHERSVDPAEGEPSTTTKPPRHLRLRIRRVRGPYADSNPHDRLVRDPAGSCGEASAKASRTLGRIEGAGSPLESAGCWRTARPWQREVRRCVGRADGTMDLVKGVASAGLWPAGLAIAGEGRAVVMGGERESSRSRARWWVLAFVVVGLLAVSSVRLVIALSPGSGDTRGDIVLTGAAIGTIILLIMLPVLFALTWIVSRRGSARLRAEYPDEVVVFASIASEQADALRSVAVKRRIFKTPRGLLVIPGSTFIHVWNARGTRLLLQIEADSVRYDVGEYRDLGGPYPALIIDIVKDGARTEVPLTLHDMNARVVPKMLGPDEIAEIVDGIRARREVSER